MSRVFLRIAVTAIISLAVSASHAETLSISADSALTSIVRHFGWLEAKGLSVEWTNRGEKADYSVASGDELLTSKTAGQQPKGIYVLSRLMQGGDTQFLQVSEQLLVLRGDQVRAVLASLERARQWLVANPSGALQIAGSSMRDLNFSGSRPGPAQLAGLRHTAQSRGMDPNSAASVLDDSVYKEMLIAQSSERNSTLAALAR